MNEERKYGLDLLKIMAIIFIIINHICQTAYENPLMLPEMYGSLFHKEYVNNDIYYLIMCLIRNFGAIGNNLFFMCSAWFLCDKKTTNYKKVITIIIDTWCISVLFLLFHMCFIGKLPILVVIKNIFPITFQNNWYVTFYVMFSVIYPLLNIIIRNISRNCHFIICLVGIIIYFGVDFLIGSYFYNSILIDYIILYFIVSYIKKYMMSFANNILYNKLMIIIGLIGTLGIMILTYLVGNKISIFGNYILHWCKINNPFVVILCIGLLNVFKDINLKSKIILDVSSLSLFIYLIHENYLFRNYSRVKMMVSLLLKYGYNNVLLIIFAFSIFILVTSIIISFIYKKTIHILAEKISGFLVKKFKIGIETKSKIRGKGV